MVEIHHLSERRACRLVELSRDCYRHPTQTDAHTQQLSERIVDIAHARRRFGYRRIHDLIRAEFPGVNHKRIYRLYKDAIWLYAGAGRPNGLQQSVCRCNWPKDSMRCGAWISSWTAWPMVAVSNA